MGHFSVRLAIASLIGLAVFGIQSPANATTQWLCKEESSQRRGNEIVSCGIGFGSDESSARLNAFDSAKSEFNRVCESSADCKSHEITTAPQRTTCEEKDSTKTGFKCYRLVVFTIGNAVPTPEKVSEGVSSNDEQISSYKPFSAEDTKKSPKVRKGMSKANLLKAFGAPESTSKFDGISGSGPFYVPATLTFNYSGDMCVYDYMLCSVILQDGRVKSYDSFKPIYTGDLDDEAAPSVRKPAASENNPSRANADSALRLIPNDLNGPDYTLLSAKSFIGTRDKNGAVKITDYTSPKKVLRAQPFGCALSFATKRKSLTFKTELQGPGSLEAFRPKSGKVTLSEDKRLLTVEAQASGLTGSMQYFFTVDADDPGGAYQMRCYLEGALVNTLNFIAE